MKPENIRNIVLIGHGGAGKTSLAEACLYACGVTSRLGSVTDGTSLMDFTEEEKSKQHSLESAVCSVTHKGVHINIIDTPGSPEFCGHAIPALAAAETAVVVVSASAGIEVNTRKMFERARAYGLGIAIVVNKLGAENVNPSEVVGQLQENFGAQCLPVNLPTGGGKDVASCFAADAGSTDFGDAGAARTTAMEAIVGCDDELMEKYLGGEASDEEVGAATPTAVAKGEFVPILFTDALAEVGIGAFLDGVVEWMPSPVNGLRRNLIGEEGETELDAGSGSDFVGQVFKVSSDPKSNIKQSYVRIHIGKLAHDTSLHTLKERKGMRAGSLLRMKGGEHSEISEATAGDIVALAKLDVHMGDAIFTGSGGSITMPALPAPMFALAIESKTRGDEDKISAVFRRFAEEDPCFTIERNATTHETVIHGVGDQHVRTLLGRLATQHKIEVETRPPKIPYRETIMGSAHGIEYTHKKQSGGSGQFGRVVINLDPTERGAGYEFADKIFGGSIDQPFRLSVDKGIQQQMRSGVLAGYPVVDVRVELIDGKTHPVDSKDIAFQIAGRGAFKDAFMKAKPTLLEPIVNIEITAPVDSVGDLQGDIASRRGQPVGQEMLPGQMAVLKAKVPLGEVSDYHSRLSSITGGRGSYMMELSHYEQVPATVQQRIVAEHTKGASDD